MAAGARVSAALLAALLAAPLAGQAPPPPPAQQAHPVPQAPPAPQVSPAPQASRVPLLVLLDGDVKQWREWCATTGWQFLGPWTDIPEKSIDLRLKALEKRVAEARQRLPVDENRIYLAGQGEAAAAVFYTASRIPDLWAAAVAVGGSARPAIDSNRLFGANTTNLPVLWLSGNPEDQALAARLKAAGYNLEFRVEPAAGSRQVFEWLAEHRRDQFPAVADCETGVTVFSRCYWLEMTRFDAAERNDVLASTRVPPIGSGASLDLGGFGYDRADTGPGVLVAWLPPNYQGPLKLNDRILAVGGKPLKDAAAYAELMDQTSEEKPVAVSVQRGKERLRLETQIVVPKREEVVTARVQGHFLPDIREIQVLSRAVSQMRVTVPEGWVPAAMSWNGTDLGKADAPGCWLFDEKNALLSARRCP